MARYTIDSKTFAVSIYFDEGLEAPNIYQPSKPDNTNWKDKAEAELWAEAFIAEVAILAEQSLADNFDTPVEEAPVE